MPLSSVSASLNTEKLRDFLEQKFALYHSPSFIANDPLCIPHLFTKKEDIEIAGFFSALLAWGNRTTIINSCKRLLQLMDNAPHQFVVQHQPADLKPLLHFVHRTFNATDLLFLLHRLQQHYLQHASLETAFTRNKPLTTEAALTDFHDYIFREPHPLRTQKHIATPQRNSACKRLCMYLRWMCRKDEGIDFGIWKTLSPTQLIIPLDVHVSRVAFRLSLISQPKATWKTALLLTENLRLLDPHDPSRFDFALFGLGREEKL